MSWILVPFLFITALFGVGLASDGKDGVGSVFVGIACLGLLFFGLYHGEKQTIKILTNELSENGCVEKIVKPNSDEVTVRFNETCTLTKIPLRSQIEFFYK